MKMEPALEATVQRALDIAAQQIADACRGGHTDDVKDAIRIARNNLVAAYDAITEAEQAARAKYWKISA